jgi:hypothetical protein
MRGDTSVGTFARMVEGHVEFTPGQESGCGYDASRITWHERYHNEGI